MKRIFIIVLVSIIFLLSPNCVNGQINQEERPNELEMKQLESIHKYQKIIEIAGEYKNFDRGFGGVFLDEEGVLNINVVENYEMEFVNQLAIPNDVKVNIVKYSLEELQSTQKMLEANMQKYNISALYVSERKNVVVIEISDSFDHNTDLLSTIVVLDKVEYVNVSFDKQPIFTADYYVHNGHYFTSGGSSFTVGFAAKDASGKDGVVTAGHIMLDVNSGDSIYYDGSVAGYRRQASFSGSADAAFIELKNTWFTKWHSTHELDTGILCETYAGTAVFQNYLMIGLSVASYGGNTGKTNGHVTATDVTQSITIGGTTYTLTHTVRADYESLPGDSGAPVTYWVWAGGTSTYRYVMGVQSYALLDSNHEWIDGVSYSGFTRVDYIASALNITFN